MLRLPPFEFLLPQTAAEAVQMRSSLPNAMYVAGGTDLLPNLKHHLHAPSHLVSLGGLQDFVGISHLEDGSCRIGAGTTLHALATDGRVATDYPGLAGAAAAIAGPQHRRMGTIGGNVLLDTRCLFYNQTAEWRKALGHCLKAEGTWCHVIGSAKGCVASQSSDTVPMLVALDAQVSALLPNATTTTVPLRTLWTKDGRLEQNRTLPSAALVTAIVLPPPLQGHASAYRKVRARGAVDFPQLGVAAAGSFDGGVCTSLEIVLGALLPHPKRVDVGFAVGERLSAELIAAVAEAAFKQARPQPQVHGDPSWRRHLVRIETVRALQALPLVGKPSSPPG